MLDCKVILTIKTDLKMIKVIKMSGKREKIGRLATGLIFGLLMGIVIGKTTWEAHGPAWGIFTGLVITLAVSIPLSLIKRRN